MAAISNLIEFATSNGGVFTKHEAVALGVSGSGLNRRVDQGIFVRIANGIFALPGTATRPDLLLRAACRTLSAVVSHESAAKLHRLGPVKVIVPSVTVSHRSTHVFHGLRVHQSTDLLEAHLVTVQGHRATSPERTVVDLAQTLNAPRLERVIDNGLAAGIVRIEPLVDLHTTLARRGKPGVAKLRAILDQRLGEPAVKQSVLEARVRELIAIAGLPQPVREFHAPWLKPIDGRVDFAYLEQRLVIEADSRRWHVMFDAFEVDKRRDNAAQVAGWRVLRFTWRMIEDEPWVVVATIRAALQQSAV